jgi:hypothetical protein
MQNFRVKGITRVEEVKVDLVKLQWAVGCKRLNRETCESSKDCWERVEGKWASPLQVELEID